MVSCMALVFVSSLLATSEYELMCRGNMFGSDQRASHTQSLELSVFPGWELSSIHGLRKRSAMSRTDGQRDWLVIQ